MVSCRPQLVLLIAIALAGIAVPSARTLADETMTKQQEQSALKFARRHHPELAELLKQLDRDMTSEYDKAIRQIHVVNERLERIKDRSLEDYNLQLNLWKVDSRIRLLAARMTMSSDEQLQVEMEKLLTQRFSLKEQQLQRDKVRTTTRLEKIDSQLENLHNNREELLKRELARYQKLQPSNTTPTATRKKNTKQKPQ